MERVLVLSTHGAFLDSLVQLQWFLIHRSDRVETEADGVANSTVSRGHPNLKCQILDGVDTNWRFGVPGMFRSLALTADYSSANSTTRHCCRTTSMPLGGGGVALSARTC